MKRITVTITDRQFDLLEFFKLKYNTPISASVRADLTPLRGDDLKELEKLRKRAATKPTAGK